MLWTEFLTIWFRPCTQAGQYIRSMEIVIQCLFSEVAMNRSRGSHRRTGPSWWNYFDRCGKGETPDDLRSRFGRKPMPLGIPLIWWRLPPCVWWKICGLCRKSASRNMARTECTVQAESWRPTRRKKRKTRQCSTGDTYRNTDTRARRREYLWAEIPAKIAHHFDSDALHRGLRRQDPVLEDQPSLHEAQGIEVAPRHHGVSMNADVMIAASDLRHRQHVAPEVEPKSGQTKVHRGRTQDARRAKRHPTCLNLLHLHEDSQAHNGSIQAHGRMCQNHLKSTEIPVEVIFSHHSIVKI